MSRDICVQSPDMWSVMNMPSNYATMDLKIIALTRLRQDLVRYINTGCVTEYLTVLTEVTNTMTFAEK